MVAVDDNKAVLIKTHFFKPFYKTAKSGISIVLSLNIVAEISPVIFSDIKGLFILKIGIRMMTGKSYENE